MAKQPQLCPRDGDVILIFGPGYWAKGDTYAEAMREYRKVNRRWRTETNFVYSAPPDVWVGEDGYIRWKRPRKANGKPDENYDILKIGEVNARKAA